MKKIIVAAALGLVAMTSVASAYDYRQSQIDAREHQQERRIQEGVRSGQLTRSEARQLEAEQARIRQMERNAQRDGRIDRREAAQIRQAQDNASRHIYQEKHDSETARTRRWW